MGAMLPRFRVRSESATLRNLPFEDGLQAALEKRLEKGQGESTSAGWKEDMETRSIAFNPGADGSLTERFQLALASWRQQDRDMVGVFE